MVRKRSCPAVSHICSLTFDSLIRIDFILKSIPIVVMKDDVNESSEYRRRRQDFPTPNIYEEIKEFDYFLIRKCIGIDSNKNNYHCPQSRVILSNSRILRHGNHLLLLGLYSSLFLKLIFDNAGIQI